MIKSGFTQNHLNKNNDVMKIWVKLLLFDDTVSARLILPEEDRKGWHQFYNVLSHSCDSWLWLAGLFLLWLIGARSLKEIALFWSAGLVVLAALVLLIKFAIRRPRPEGEWGKIYRVTDPHSFPSGHAARAAAIAVMATQFGLPWVVLVLGIWAILVGLSRIALKLHYFSDVLVGWLIGLLSGYFILNFYPRLVHLIPGFIALLTHW